MASRGKPPFAITEEWPTPILRDFDVFLDAVAKPSAFLHRSRQTLDWATLYATNPLMRTCQSEAHPRMDQAYYPLLNLFQRICVAARLHALGYEKGKLRMIPTEGLARLRERGPAERFMALLEALWVDCDWEEIRGKHRRASSLLVPDLAKSLSTAAAGREINERDAHKASPNRRLHLGFYAPEIMRIFSFLGFVEYTLAPEPSRGYPYKGMFGIRTYTVSALGKAFLRILHKERPWTLWNVPGRVMWYHAAPQFPGERIEGEDGGVAQPTPFYKAFLPLFPPGSLTTGLPREERKAADQTFVFRVSLGRSWRTIALSSEHTLDDLHDAIQQAYRFDNDHLYAFYMDGKPYSRKVYYDPRGNDWSPCADDAVIGELDLFVRQRILYLFDFGDQWLFDVELREVRDKPHRDKPKILKRKGKSPEQYRFDDM